MRLDRPLVPLLLLLGACAAPPLEQEPWTAMHSGAFGLRDIQPLVAFFDNNGKFVGPTVGGGTQPPPPPGTIPVATEFDSEPVESKFGHGLAFEYFITDDWATGMGAEYRKYGIEDFGPPGLEIFDPFTAALVPIPTALDDLSTIQYYVFLRRYLEPFPGIPRLRPFLGVYLDWIPEVESDVLLDFSNFAGGQLQVPPGLFEGEDLILMRMTAGLVYQWTDRIVLQGGVSAEFPLSGLEGEIEQPFNEQVGSIFIETEIEPHGFMAFAGLTYYP